MTEDAQPLEVPNTWDSDALLAKAQRYIEATLAQPKDQWTFALFSSLCLELLCRAALAKVSPVLLADPNDWNNIYYALGYTPTAKKFSPKSIDIKTVIDRLGETVPGFTDEHQKFCALHATKRNAELHCGDMPFDDEKHSAWLPKFYKACSILLKFLDTKLSDFVGESEVKVADKLMSAAADEFAKAARGTVEAYKKVWLAKPEEDRKNSPTKLTSGRSGKWGIASNVRLAELPLWLSATRHRPRKKVLRVI